VKVPPATTFRVPMVVEVRSDSCAVGGGSLPGGWSVSVAAVPGVELAADFTPEPEGLQQLVGSKNSQNKIRQRFRAPAIN